VKVLVVTLLILFSISCMAPSFVHATSLGFTNHVIISNISSDSQSPMILVSNDGVFVLWVENKNGRSDIFFTKSVDGGITFETPVNLSASLQGQSGYATFAQKDKDVYVVWQTSISGTAGVFLARSLDGGTNFEKPIMLSDISKLSAFPQVSMSNNHVYSTWIEKSDNNSTNIVFVKRDIQGNAFDAPLYITHNTGNSGIPKILADENKVYLIWEDNSRGNFEVYISKSNDYGKSFQGPIDVSNNTGQSGTPQIMVSKDNVYAVWMDNVSGNYDILFAKSADGGKSFGTPVNISKFHGDSGYPQLVVFGNDVYVAWTQTISNQNYDVFFTKSSNNGDTFDTPINLSNNSGSSGWSQISVDGDNVYVNWVDSTSGRFDVFVTKSTDNGRTFESPTNISTSKNESYESKMTIFNNTVFVVWQEGSSGSHTIVLSKSITTVPEFTSFALPVFLVSLIAIICICLKSNTKLKINF
jgi:hypothetical protein